VSAFQGEAADSHHLLCRIPGTLFDVLGLAGITSNHT
jgi:hypothetical protein